ncbi:MAG: transporter [Lautropia sp.]
MTLPTSTTATLTVALLVFAGAALALQPLVTDDTGTQGAGGNQIEAGLDFARTGESEGTARSVEVPLAYTRGITDTLDVLVSPAWQRQRPADGSRTSGWGNPSIGAKWRFREDKASGLSFGAKPELVLPISEARERQGLGTAKPSWRMTLIATQAMSWGELNANLAWARVDAKDEALAATLRRDQFRLSVAPVVTLDERWKATFDLGVQSTEARGGKRHQGYAQIGVVHAPTQDLELALGLTRDFSTGDARTTSLLGAITWRFR